MSDTQTVSLPDAILEGIYALPSWERERARIRMGRDAYNSMAEMVAGPKPSLTLAGLGPKFDAMVEADIARYVDSLKRFYEAWGKEDITLWGYPLDCVNDLDGWEVVTA